MVMKKYKLSSFHQTKKLLEKDDDLPEPFLFREKLYVFDENGQRIGRFLLNIDQAEDKILYVHISNRAFINGKLSESIVTGTVTKKLKTLEEIRYEATEISTSKKHERCLFLLRERTKYYLSASSKICKLKKEYHATISFSEALGLLGESANALLLRKLARLGHEGILSLTTVLSNGKRCKNYYVLLTRCLVSKLSEQVVNGKRMQVLIVYRNITNHYKYNLTMTLALTRAGQIIYLFWSNSKCFLHIDPSVKLNTHWLTYGEPMLEAYWHKDVQMHSMYLDVVDRQAVLTRSFKYHREDLRRILGDFVEYVLLMKPNDVVCFAIQYFTAFGHSLMQKCPLAAGPNSGLGDYYGKLTEETEKGEKMEEAWEMEEGGGMGEVGEMEEAGEMFNLWLGESIYQP